jgi:2-hydroxy fatty acid dioxygenase
MQIHPGHAVFEGRKPALLDSFVQSLVVAPLFVFLELLFALGEGECI